LLKEFVAGVGLIFGLKMANIGSNGAKEEELKNLQKTLAKNTSKRIM
jgi:hypothetical protein